MFEQWSSVAADGVHELSFSTDSASMKLLCGLSEFLLYPLSFVDDSRLSAGNYSADQMLLISKNRFFSRPVEKMIIGELNLDKLVISQSFIESLVSSHLARISVIVVILPVIYLTRLALELTGAVLSRRLLKLLLKKDKELLINALGVEAFSVATREVPVLHKDIGKLGVLHKDVPLDELIGTTQQALLYGYQILDGFLAYQEDALVELFRMRVPLLKDRWDEGGLLGVEQTRLAIARFIRRRCIAWDAFTG